MLMPAPTGRVGPGVEVGVRVVLAGGDTEGVGVREGELPGEVEAVAGGIQDTRMALPPTPAAADTVL